MYAIRGRVWSLCDDVFFYIYMMFVCVCFVERERESIRPPVIGLKRPSCPVFDGYLILHRPPYLMSAIYTTKWFEGRGGGKVFFRWYRKEKKKKKGKPWSSCRSSYPPLKATNHPPHNLLVARVIISSSNDATTATTRVPLNNRVFSLCIGSKVQGLSRLG